MISIQYVLPSFLTEIHFIRLQLFIYDRDDLELVIGLILFTLICLLFSFKRDLPLVK
jgi:hypothetical protein